MFTGHNLAILKVLHTRLKTLTACRRAQTSRMLCLCLSVLAPEGLLCLCESCTAPVFAQQAQYGTACQDAAERKLRHAVRHVRSVSSRCAGDLNSGVKTELPYQHREPQEHQNWRARVRHMQTQSEAQASIKETGCSKSRETKKTRGARNIVKTTYTMVVSSEDITRKSFTQFQRCCTQEQQVWMMVRPTQALETCAQRKLGTNTDSCKLHVRPPHGG